MGFALRFILAGSLLIMPVLAQAAEPAVPAHTVQSHAITQELVVDGVVEAVFQGTLRAKTSGTIVELNFDVNDFVKKDMVLMRFRDTMTQAGVEQAEAGLKEAQARMDEAEKMHGRVKQLFAKQMATAAKMDEAEAGLSAARARLQAAQAQVEKALEGAADTVVRAPYSGYVVKRFVELGESAQVGQPLFSGMSLEKLRVKAAIPQGRFATVRSLAKARVLADDQVVTVAGDDLNFFYHTEQSSNLFGVRLQLPDGVEGLFPGMLVKVAFAVGESKQLMVPAAAVVQRSELTAVYVVGKQGAISLRQVRTGSRHDQGRMVELLAGLSEGESVALDTVLAGRFLNQSRKGAQ